jgi:hypothetical protein
MRFERVKMTGCMIDVGRLSYSTQGESIFNDKTFLKEVDLLCQRSILKEKKSISVKGISVCMRVEQKERTFDHEFEEKHDNGYKIPLNHAHEEVSCSDEGSPKNN